MFYGCFIYTVKNIKYQGGVNHAQDNRGGYTIPAIQDQDAETCYQIGGYVMPMIEQEPQQDFCKLVGLLAIYLEKHTDGVNRVKEFLLDEQYLWDTQDVMNFTGWKRTYIQRLVSTGQLPYISGKPHKFIPSSVKKTLEQMQQGGQYGKRKSTLKTKITKGR